MWMHFKKYRVISYLSRVQKEKRIDYSRLLLESHIKELIVSDECYVKIF